MQYKYVCKADAAKHYDAAGVSALELPLDADFPDVRANGIKFYRYSLKAGSYIYPALSRDKIVMLMFNGSRAFVSCGEKVYHVTEPAFFLPDFDKQPYLVGAVEDTEFILCEFGMNEEDWKSYRNWHRRLPFFKLYTDGVRYDQACKMPGTCSWSILQGVQIGHISVGVVRAIGAGTDELGHSEVHQWNYCLGNSDFTLDVEGETDEQRPGDFSFIYAGRDHKLLAKPDKEVFYVWVEFYTTESLDEFWYSYVHNETSKDAYSRYLEKAAAAEMK